MKNILGAQRPASTRNVLWIAVAAIVLIAVLTRAALSQSTGDNWFGMGSDNVMGMMPPNGMYDGGTAQQAARTQLAKRSVKPPVLNIQPRCAPSGVITIHQSRLGKSYTYTSTKSGCVYTIARGGQSLFTVTYDSSSRTYKLTDPDGSRELLLELGIAPGQFHASNSKRISR